MWFFRNTTHVLPAYAGMILELEKRASELQGAPRVCGDDPLSLLPLR